MRPFFTFAAAVIISSGLATQAVAETWISTWAAPAFARLDQPLQTLSPTAQTFPWAREVPVAASGQELAVSGASPVHYLSASAQWPDPQMAAEGCAAQSQYSRDGFHDVQQRRGFDCRRRQRSRDYSSGTLLRAAVARFWRTHRDHAADAHPCL